MITKSVRMEIWPNTTIRAPGYAPSYEVAGEFSLGLGEASSEIETVNTLRQILKKAAKNTEEENCDEACLNWPWEKRVSTLAQHVIRLSKVYQGLRVLSVSIKKEQFTVRWEGH
jgi:hypothetical protein